MTSQQGGGNKRNRGGGQPRTTLRLDELRQERTDDGARVTLQVVVRRGNEELEGEQVTLLLNGSEDSSKYLNPRKQAVWEVSLPLGRSAAQVVDEQENRSPIRYVEVIKPPQQRATELEYSMVGAEGTRRFTLVPRTKDEIAVKGVLIRAVLNRTGEVLTQEITGANGSCKIELNVSADPKEKKRETVHFEIAGTTIRRTVDLPPPVVVVPVVTEVEE